MRFQFISFIFFILLLADLVVLQTNFIELRPFTKGLIVPALILYVLLYQRKFTWLLVGLIFTWIGDIALIYEGELFFILGLGAFLFGHVFYIFQINQLPKKRFSSQYVLISLLGIIGLTYLWFIQPYAKTLFIPVILYVFTISMMVIRAFRQTKSELLKVGALFFLVSDCILGLKTFGAFDFPYSEIAVMATYGIAQYLIVYGVVREK